MSFKRDYVTIWSKTDYNAADPYGVGFNAPLNVLARYKLDAKSHYDEKEQEVTTTDMYVMMHSPNKGDRIAVGYHTESSPVDGAKTIKHITKAISNNQIMVVAG